MFRLFLSAAPPMTPHQGPGGVAPLAPPQERQCLKRLLRGSISLVILLFSWCMIQSRWRNYINKSNDYTFPEGIALKDGATFDYIVVGAGAAGCAAAARLALHGAAVLLVEAGGDPPAVAKVPGGVVSLLGSEYDWKYQTTSNNKSCLSYKCRFSRGKCLGGSTSINHMLYTRGSRRDYDYNLPGWTWEDLKPYFLRYEGLQDFDQLPSSFKSHHNSSGLMKISFFNTSDPWHSKVMDGYRELNFPLNEDVNGDTQIGIGRIPGYVYGRERMSTARAYLTRDDVKRRLKVAKNALCTGVIIKNNVAKGIKVVQGTSNKTLHIYARKEVILSAGTIGTSHILLLSGIGPAKHLQELGIPVHSDLPIGENISEHVTAHLFLLVDRSPGIVGDLAMFAEKVGDVMQYAMSRDGPLASIGLVDIGTFANTRCYNSSAMRLELKEDCELPNLQIIHMYVDRMALAVARPILERGGDHSTDLNKQLVAASIKYALLLISPVNLAPYSRGTIRLASSDPLIPPAIYPNFLADERDLNEVVRSISIVEDLLKTSAFRKEKAKILRFKLPGCPKYEKGKEEYWRCYVRHLSAPAMHAVGSVALGVSLDVRLQVRGVARLRVADASALPRVPRGSTEAAVIAFGERVVDFLMEDNDRQKLNKLI